MPLCRLHEIRGFIRKFSSVHMLVAGGGRFQCIKASQISCVRICEIKSFHWTSPDFQADLRFFTIKFACFGEYLNTRIYEFYSLVLKVLLLLLAHFSMLSSLVSTLMLMLARFFLHSTRLSVYLIFKWVREEEISISVCISNECRPDMAVEMLYKQQHSSNRRENCFDDDKKTCKLCLHLFPFSLKIFSVRFTWRELGKFYPLRNICFSIFNRRPKCSRKADKILIKANKRRKVADAWKFDKACAFDMGIFEVIMLRFNVDEKLKIPMRLSCSDGEVQACKFFDALTNFISLRNFMNGIQLYLTRLWACGREIDWI